MIKVTLRQKAITKGRNSLYLDFYPEIIDPSTGKKTRREFLKMYVFQKPKNPIEKAHNKETTLIANSICQKRTNELNKPEVYNDIEKAKLDEQQKGELSFVKYFKKLADKRKSSNHDNWISAYNYLVAFSGGELKFKDLDTVKLEEFKDYLLNTKSLKNDKKKLSQNSALSYFNKVKATLKQAFQDGILKHDLNARIKPIKALETQRNFLTLDELQELVKTPCNDLILKNAALFSALTGQRFSDIQKLTWKEIQFVKGQGHFWNYRQKKTKSVEQLPISDNAIELIGERGEPDEKVFPNLTYSAYGNKHLAQWIGAAGITKNITFHCFRHTFATLQAFENTNPVVVQKLLGHKSIKTTMIYYKIAEEAKREAVNKIKLEL